MQILKHLLKHNWHLKLLCLGAAVTLALFVRKQEDLLRRRILLPVKIDPPPGQRVVEPPSNTSVQVDLEGPAEVVRAVEDDDVRLDFDPSGALPGQRKWAPVTVHLPEKYRDRVMVDWRPRSLPVLLVSDKSQEFPVILKPLERPEGWELRDAQVSPSRVTVSGTAEAVGRVATVAAAFNVEPTERINTLVTLQALDGSGNIVRDAVHLEPAQVLVTGMQQRVVLQKRVPVQPVFEAPAGMRVSVEVSPARVRLVGPESEVSKIYVVETERVIIPAGQAQLTQQISVAVPPGGVSVTPQRVKVTFRLQPGAVRPGSPAAAHPR